MATVTPNFNWPVPTSTDLVKDGAVAIEALGDSIDASLVDLKGGTTGQVLSKASNTDMDFVWVTDAAGDITGVTAGTGLTGGGTSGTVSLAFDVANYGGGQYSAGKNKFINGDFKVWQRGTSINVPNTTFTYGPDRFMAYLSFSAGSASWSQQTFTPGTAPVAGYEGTYFARLTCASTTSYTEISQRIEDVRTFAGQTITFSFWAKSSAALVITPYVFQNYGTGGSAQTAASASNVTLTTSWTRYTGTMAVPSIAGKTIGTSSFLQATMIYAAGTLNNATIDIWGWQIEDGSTATPFQTATGNLASELQACQRYYYRLGAGGGGFSSGVQFGYLLDATASSSTNLYGILPLPVTMRKTASSVDFSNIGWIVTWGAGVNAISAVTIYDGSGVVGTTPQAAVLQMTTTGATANNRYPVLSNNSTAAYLGINAEL